MTEYERLSLLLLSNILTGIQFGIGDLRNSTNPTMREEAGELTVEWMKRTNAAMSQVYEALERGKKGE